MFITDAEDTSRTSTCSFLKAMMRFTGVQDTAQNHINAVVGIVDYLHVYNDMEKIPYVRYLLKEV